MMDIQFHTVSFLGQTTVLTAVAITSARLTTLLQPVRSVVFRMSTTPRGIVFTNGIERLPFTKALNVTKRMFSARLPRLAAQLFTTKRTRDYNLRPSRMIFTDIVLGLPFATAFYVTEKPFTAFFNLKQTALDRCPALSALNGYLSALPVWMFFTSAEGNRTFSTTKIVSMTICSTFDSLKHLSTIVTFNAVFFVMRVKPQARAFSATEKVLAFLGKTSVAFEGLATLFADECFYHKQPPVDNWRICLGNAINRRLQLDSILSLTNCQLTFPRQNNCTINYGVCKYG